MNLNIPAQTQKHLTILFFLLLTLVGLFLGGGYGVPWDERTEQQILNQNLYEYANDILGENASIVRAARENGVILISDGVDRDHGSALFYPLAFLSFLENTHLIMQIWHIYIWLVFMLGVIAVYWIMRELGVPRIIGCMASLLLYLSPRFFAQGHYNNKDVMLLSLILLTFAFAARLSRSRKFSLVLLYSLAGAFATNLKIIGVFAWGLAGVAVLWRWLSERRINRKDLWLLISGVAVFIVAYILITPAMWSSPVEYFRYLYDNMIHFSRWDGVVLFQGQLYKPASGAALPWYYLPQLILITIPVPYLLLALFGQGYAIFLCIRGNLSRPMLVTLTVFWILPLVYVMLADTLIYNGWRHFYFVNAGLVVMGGIGIWWLYRLMCKTFLLKAMFALAAASLFVFQTTSILINHPYQYAYYNILAGPVEDRYELDYWAVSTYNALEKLANSTARNQALPLAFSTPPTNSSQFEYPLDENYEALPEKIKSKLQYVSYSEDVPYLIYNSTSAVKNRLAPPVGYSELFSISSYGHILVTVYEQNSAE
ncbi:MAG: phospholipid carrier-dependent glycosyltransferase [Clostridiales bacterium]|nr:phospholipid carrier-dependent glycosyltransferase [Clostridiales bacterium]